MGPLYWVSGGCESRMEGIAWTADSHLQDWDQILGHIGRWPIDDLQSIPRESNDKDIAATLDELKIEANEESFVIILQHGGNDVA